MSYYIDGNIIKTEDIEFDFTELGGLGNIIFNSMKKYKHKVAQIDPETDIKDTYENMLQRSIRTAMVMKHKGVKQGDLVFGCTDNHLDACVPIVAAWFLGAVPCFADLNFTPLEMAYVLDQVKPKMIFSIPSKAELINQLCVDAELVVFGNSNKNTEFQSFLERQIGEDEFEATISYNPKETAMILFTSEAKACCLSHEHLIWQSNLVPTNTPVEHLDLDRRNFEWSKIKRGGAVLSYSPLLGVSEAKTFLENAVVGTARVVCRSFDPKAFWYIVDKYRVLQALLTPFHLSELAENPPPAKINTDTLLKIFTGGSHLQRKHWDRLRSILPDTDIIQSYGLTETGLITTYETYNVVQREYYRTHQESVGFPTRGVWYKVVDPVTEEPLGPNQQGELRVKSKYFTNGYLNKSSNSLHDSEGWLKTGDVVYYTDNCALYIVDSLKDVIKYKQRVVYPSSIEKQLMLHPDVAHAVVLGKPDRENGEQPVALVVLNKNSESVTVEEIQKFLNGRLGDETKLRGGVRIVKSFPRTDTGKVKRRELRRMLVDERR
ncbi:hypothetical protein NQ315_004381 [Exocentrus adspersus]|uniref:Uncharacterized protein n=1 Tax=Exocentrus adspersus TaxID=1586481 RepID=A0AAV8W7F0_9CUCU|nr:hypothetical protein NQ315_004381 [Exocentrus adspersus]